MRALEMASSVISFLEEEATEASLPSRKRFRRLSESLGVTSAVGAEKAEAADEDSGIIPFPSDAARTDPLAHEASKLPSFSHVLAKDATKPRLQRQVFSNLSRSFRGALDGVRAAEEAESKTLNCGQSDSQDDRCSSPRSSTTRSKKSCNQQLCSRSTGFVAHGNLKRGVLRCLGGSSSTSIGDASAPDKTCGASTGETLYSKLRERLPVWRFRDELRKKVTDHQVVLVVGETGSGKTTQVPQLLLHWGLFPDGWIAISQPRRVAAVSLARRVSAEVGDDEVGGVVGYAVRFERKLSRRTRICFMTDGMLVREALIDPKLKRISALVLDEVHERGLQTDFLLGLAKLLMKQRPELKVLLMSATMQTERLTQFFPEAAVVSIPGSTFPLKTFYVSEPQEDFLEAALLSVLQIHLGDAGDGDILVFLPGQEEIETLAAMLRSKLKLLDAFAAKHRQDTGEQVEFSVRLGDEVYRHRKLERLLVCPIYAALPFDKQQQVLLPAPPQYTRKAVLATNIAETSLTVSGIRFVVDTGLCKAKARDHRTLTEALLLQEISQDSAKQRAGRAGREAAGTVYRLYTEDCFQKLHAHKTPEILSCDLSQLFLQLKALRIDNPLEFPLLDAPPREAFSSAGRHLYRLDAIDDAGDITALGRRLTALPLPPQLGAMLLAAEALDCEEAALTLAAMLSAENVWATPFSLSRDAAAALGKARKRFTDPQSDHLTLVGAYNHWAEQADDPQAFCREAGLQHSAMLRARAIRQQLHDALKSVGVRPNPSEASLDLRDKPDLQQQGLNLRRCMAKSCWQQAARLQPETRQFVTAVHRQTVKIHPTSVLCGAPKLPQWVIYTELVHTSKAYMRCVTAIEAPWLKELAPKWFTTLRA
ncbi:hypothetical protein Efla_005905 [Eimeria flavescens]